MQWKLLRLAPAVLLALAAASGPVAKAQDVAPAVPPPAEVSPPPAPSTGAQATYVAPSNGSSGLAIEFQGRLSLLSAFELLGTGASSPVLVPPATLGVRLLDQRLYVGLGASFQRSRVDVCTTGTSCSGGKHTNTSIFTITPVVTFDVLSRGGAHLYPLLMMHFGVSDLVADNDFVFGANVGIGLRGDIGDVVSIGTEWGWGFFHGNATTGGGGFPGGSGSEKYTMQGFFGTVNLSARLGL